MIYDWATAEPHFGTLTDRQIADRFDIPRVIVSNRRSWLGIPVVRRWEKHEHLLGTMPDAELAAIVGITPNAVTRKRGRMGIPRFGPSLEAQLETAFCATLNEPYERQVTTPLGRIDVLTDTMIYECKHRLGIGELHKALGQLLCYDAILPALPCREMAIVCAEVDLPEQAKVFLMFSFGIEIIVVEPPAMDTRKREGVEQ